MTSIVQELPIRRVQPSRQELPDRVPALVAEIAKGASQRSTANTTHLKEGKVS